MRNIKSSQKKQLNIIFDQLLFDHHIPVTLQNKQNTIECMFQAYYLGMDVGYIKSVKKNNIK